MLYDIVAAEARGEFKLWVRFEDGLEGVVDLSHLVGSGVFKRWADDPEEFEQVAVDSESGTVVWPGGLDVAPDGLYDTIAASSGRVSSEAQA